MDHEPPYPGAKATEAELCVVESVPDHTLEVDAQIGAEWWAKQVDRVAADFLQVFLRDPSEALGRMKEFLDKFADINGVIGILTRVMPVQFGAIANIASTGYEELDIEGRKKVMEGIHAFLGTKSSTYSSHVGQLRNPALLRDMVYHWSAANWPHLGDYSHFLEHATPGALRLAMQDDANSPLSIALAVPLASTPEPVRLAFRHDYQQLSDQALEVIAAHPLCSGAHDEILDKTNRAKRWEQSIVEGLQAYAEEYQAPLLEITTNNSFAIFDEDFSFEKLVKKLRTTTFALSDGGHLIRQSANKPRA